MPKKEYIDPFKHTSTEVKDDSITIDGSTDEFTRIETDGTISFRRKGYEDTEIPAPEPRPQRTNKELWVEYHAKKKKK